MAEVLQPGFYALAYGIDGELVGSGFWECSKLSDRWLNVCEGFLKAHDPSFEDSWEADLSHIRTKVTSASGAALVTFLIHGIVSTSILLLTGTAPVAEKSVAQMFVESLKRTKLVRTATQSSLPFREILSTQQRPLMVAVPWPNSSVSASDRKSEQELAIHFAAAFFAIHG